MKRINLMFIATILLSFFIMYSCKKSENGIDRKSIDARTMASEYDDITLEEFMEFDIDDQREIFSGLNPEDRLRLWEERIDYLIVNLEQTDPNYEDQVMALESLQGLLTDNLFTNGPTTQDENNFDNWLVTYVDEVFPIETARIIANTFGPIGIPAPPNNGVKCNCSTDDDWCPGGAAAYCSSNMCNDGSSWGCGFFWAYSCNGKCTIFG